ncbi:A-kinase anchor protein 17B [Vigna unguiculata]|uniref:A-kinase anchor protein 17B n=1 Tax=Vigna unguiculata TaxID=3917 RepID=UPI001016839F|nr:A-kinase anchor protein 17B [Vigna unguiculata]
MSEEKRKEEEEEEALKTLEIENGLRLVPRVKLNLVIYPSTPLTLSHPIDEWKTRRALIEFLHTSLSLTLPEEDLHLTRNKNLKKRKRDDPVAAGTLRVWDLSSLPKETRFVEWRNRLVENLNAIELNLEGVKFKLAVTVPVSDDFDRMKKDWEEHSASRSRREPDTVVLRGVPSRWFAEPRVSSKPSMLVTHTIFSTFGKIRNLNVAEDNEFGKDENEGSGDLVSGLYCKIVVQFDKYKDCNDAMRVLCGRSMQKEGSRLKADYEVSWEKDDFFRNSRNEREEKKNSTVSTKPENVRARRFKE